MKSDFEVLKKKYGENFAKLCRSLFPTILETEGQLSSLIESKFYPSHFLYDDLIENNKVNDFKNYIYSFVETNIETKEVTETPEQLFDKSGYVLIKCETNEDVQEFKRYYKTSEQLCTFRDPNRIKNYTIFWAIKKNVNEIKRENFINPMRQDEYGTSVISLQFTKGEHSTLSIKNRYNHTVDNPDATFSNYLENIQAGLTQSFEKYYGINLVNSKYVFEMSNYVMARDGKLYRYNYEIDNKYYCSDNIIIDRFNVKYYDKSRYEIIDYFLLDKQEKKLTDFGFYEDSFLKDFQNIGKITITKTENGSRLLEFLNKDNTQFQLIVNKYNQIIKYTNENVKSLNYGYLYFNKTLQELNLPNVKRIGNDCFYCNLSLLKLELPKTEFIGNNFLTSNNKLIEFIVPNLEAMCEACLCCNTTLEIMISPKLSHIQAYTLWKNHALKLLDIPEMDREAYYTIIANNPSLFKNKLKDKTANFELNQ